METIKKQLILLASDTHGRSENLERMLRAFSFDALIFCGDGEGVEQDLAFLAGCPAQVNIVRGNNDYNFSLMDDITVQIGDMRAFVTHGNRYRLYEGPDMLGMAARGRNCNICLYGHIHRPVCEKRGGLLYINPGSLSEPRQEDHIPTCAVLEAEGKKLRVRFVNAVTIKEYPEEGREFIFEF